MRRLFALLLGISLLAGLGQPANAQAAQIDKAYTYNEDDKAVPSPNSYQFKTIINAQSLGIDSFSSAQDLFVDSQDQIYLLDSGKKRVIWIDENYELVHIIDSFTWKDEPLTLADGAQGIFYREATQSLYIADTNNNRIIVCDRTGAVSQVYTKPETALLDNGLPYAPTKLVVDELGLMYVLTLNVNTGALMIDSENQFLGFYGVNAIKETLELKIEHMWRSIMNTTQNSQSEVSFQPTELANLYWSDDFFIYAVSPVTDTVESPVVKLNPVGENVLDGTEFGDSPDEEYEDVPIFTDITADAGGVFTVLDLTSGKIYQYDEECTLMTVFGGLGYQKGLYQLPVSIESNSGGDILVLDAKKNTITVMEQTYYGEKIREALFLYNDGLYEEALECWFEILRMNANYSLAYVGIAEAYLSMGEYRLAMDYFYQGGDKDGYSEAKTAMWREVLRNSFAFVAAVVVVIMLLILCYDGIKKYSKLTVQTLKKKRKGVES